MKMCQVVIWQCEGYTQYKPEVVDYYEQFRDFLHQILKVYAQRESFEEITTIATLLEKFWWLLTSMLFSLNFVKFMGDFCKVFAPYIQVRDSTAFLYQIAGILLLMSTTNLFLVVLKSFRSYRF